jgi:collagen type VI alpha
VGFIVDSSGSIKDQGANNWDDILSFIASITERFDIGPSQTRVGLVSFSNEAYLRVKLNQYYDKQELVDYILRGDFYSGGQTNTYVSHLCQ